MPDLYPGRDDGLPSIPLLLTIATGVWILLWLLPQPNRPDDSDEATDV